MKKKYLSLILAAILIHTINSSCKKFVTKTLYSNPKVNDISHNSASVTTEIREVGAELNYYGHCYSTYTNPTIVNIKTTHLSIKSETGNFTEKITDLYPNTTYYIRAYAVEDEIRYSSKEQNFTTTGIPTANVTTKPANFISTFDAKLNGTVNANGNNSLVYFEYGTNTNYEFTTSNVHAPTVITEAADAVSTTKACLNGIVNPNGYDATAIFEWGKTLAYGNEAVINEGTITGSTNESVTANLTDLTQGTTYHYRIKAVSSEVTSFGNDVVYTTTANYENKELTLNGVYDYVVTSDNSNIDLNQSFSIELSIKPHNIAGIRNILGKQ